MSIIRPVLADNRRLYQNQEVYDRAVADLEGNAEIAALTAHVLKLEPTAEVLVFVNPCTRYWTPGTEADYATFIHLTRYDGSNRLCYNGSGNIVSEAVQKAITYFDQFLAKEEARRTP